jgi:hypothetical protein
MRNLEEVIDIGSPAYSLHVAVAIPAATRLVREYPDLCRDAPKLETSVFRCVTHNLAISSSLCRNKDSCAPGFAFLCSPPTVWAFHLETTSERTTRTRGTCLLAFPHQRGWGIAGGCFIGFVLADDLEEEAI